ncbi:MAG: Glycosyl transferase, family 2 [Microgenomates group bacterium GW2011_GWA1_48_10]|nr:MAG: Glycosyl transferase, family 2 [Microgenomates group bacterium GW2011_GWA1_48_10]
MEKTELSIATILHNEEANVVELHRRLSTVLKTLNKTHEIILVDDGSTDRTLDKLKTLRQKDRSIKIISLSRNFGIEAAATAALDHTSGEMVVLMDGDLQDAPEFIPSLLNKIGQGYDVVYAQHPKRKDTLVKQALFGSFYRLMDKLADYKFPVDVGHFSVMRRPVVDVLTQMTERNRFIAGLRAWVGFKQTGILYEKQARFAGKPPQTFKKLLKMGFDALFSFSYIPLRVATLMGLLVAIGTIIVIINVLYQKFVVNTAIIGWAGPMLSILIIGGVQLFILGIIGEYLARIYDEVKRRPYYIVSEKIGF